MNLDHSPDSRMVSTPRELKKSAMMKQMFALATELDVLRREGALCDVTVTVDDKQFRAHKIILAALSDVFRAMFMGGLKEASQSEIVLQDDVDLSAEGFEILLDFAYSANLNLSIDNVFEVLACACHLSIKVAIDSCVIFINQCFQNGELSFDDYLKIASMAGNYSLDNLKKVADHYIASNFGEVSQTEDFLEHMTAHNLGQFLVREDLAVSSEAQVLKAAVSWLHHKPSSRFHHATAVIKKVRLGLVSAQDLDDLMDSKILSIPQCKTMFDQLIKHFALNSPISGQLVNKHPEFFSARVSTKSLLAIGGQTTTGFARFFSQDKQEWLLMPRFPGLPFDGVSYHRLISVIGKLFLVGGVFTEYLKSYTQKYFYVYDLVANKWTRLPPMKVARSHVAVAHLNGYIYAIGGMDDKDAWIQSVERYDLSRGEWETVAPIPADMSGMHPSSVAYHERIFVTSLNIDNSGQHVYSLDPNTNTWRSCDSIITSNPGQLVHLDSSLFLITYKTQTSKLGRKELWDYCPIVNEIITRDESRGFSYVIDQLHAHDQSQVPESDLRPFCVGKRVYLMVNGEWLDSRIDVKEGQVYDVNLNSWTKLFEKTEGASITLFTFNAHKFMSSYVS